MEVGSKFAQFYSYYRGEAIGASCGLAVAICFLKLGVFKTVFVGACVIIGYHIGKRMSKDRDYVKNLLDRILPPGTYR